MELKNNQTLKKINKAKAKKYFYIAGFVLFIAFLLFINRTREDKKEVTPSPTPQSGVDTLTNPEYKLNVEQVHPKSGQVEMAQTRTSISLFFEREVDPKSIKITATPYIEFAIKSHPDFSDRIILEPKTAWVDGTTYKITIHKGARTLVEGLTLQEDIELEYKIIKAPRPVYTGPT